MCIWSHLQRKTNACPLFVPNYSLLASIIFSLYFVGKKKLKTRVLWAWWKKWYQARFLLCCFVFVFNWSCCSSLYLPIILSGAKIPGSSSHPPSWQVKMWANSDNSKPCLPDSNHHQPVWQTRSLQPNRWDDISIMLGTFGFLWKRAQQWALVFVSRLFLTRMLLRSPALGENVSLGRFLDQKPEFWRLSLLWFLARKRIKV